MSESVPKTALQLVAKVNREQRMQFKVTPMPDSLFPAGSIGGQLTALADLFSALGKQDGINLKTLIAGIKMHENGAIEFDLVITPVS